MFYFECRAECWTHSSIFKMYVFECRAECRTHSSIFKVCFILNAELNVELTARYSRCMFSNAELNVEPIARYSKCVLFWMQSWTSISQLDILIFLVLLVEYRAECRSHSSIFADYVCQYIAEYRLSIPLPTSQTWYKWCILERAVKEIKVKVSHSLIAVRAVGVRVHPSPFAALSFPDS